MQSQALYNITSFILRQLIDLATSPEEIKQLNDAKDALDKANVEHHFNEQYKRLKRAEARMN